MFKSSVREELTHLMETVQKLKLEVEPEDATIASGQDKTVITEEMLYADGPGTWPDIDMLLVKIPGTWLKH